jgi:hypothetical protein
LAAELQRRLEAIAEEITILGRHRRERRRDLLRRIIFGKAPTLRE